MNIATEVANAPAASRFSIRFWERGRLAYNAAQLLVTAGMLVVHWRDAHFFVDNLDAYVAFAVMANLLYTTAYLTELVLLIPQLRRFAQPVRWCVLIAGTVFACFLAGGVLEAIILRDPADD